MLVRMLRAEFQHSRATSLLLVFLVGLSALLVATSAGIFGTLLSSQQALGTAARTPDLVLMLNEDPGEAFADFARSQPDIAHAHVQELLTLGPSQLAFNGERADADTQENSLVTQNAETDLLLDLHNQPLRLAPGEIAVPLFHQQLYDLHVGDTVTAAGKDFRLVSFLRDSTMNPGLASSKRFLISEADFAHLRPLFPAPEYLATITLTDAAADRVGAVETAYHATDLPQPTVAVTKKLFAMMSMLSSGMLALVSTVAAALLLSIAALCLRFSFLTAAERDRPDIATMKAIGIRQRTISGLYLWKYTFIAAVAGGLGYVGSGALTPRLSRTITLYNGTNHHPLLPLIPLIAVILMCAALIGWVALLVRGIGKLTAYEAFRPPATRAHAFRLRPGPLHVQLGLIDVAARWKTYALTLGVYVVSAFLILTPLNLATTVKDDAFINYLGLVDSQAVVVLRPGGDLAQRFHAAQQELDRHPRVAEHAGYITAIYQVKGPQGWQHQPISTGNHLAFPLGYLAGHAPQQKADLAVSWALAQELGVEVGDTLPVRGRDETTVRVCGIYQDVTNGGLTAKATESLLDVGGERMQYLFAINTTAASPQEVLADIGFGPARINDADEFVEQTMGETRRQVTAAAWVSAIAALGLAALMTALFAGLLIARDRADIALQSRIGIGQRGIYIQYLARMWFLLILGLVLATLAANLLGPQLIGIARGLGAPEITMVVNYPLAYGAAPGALFIAVTAALLPAIRLIPKLSSHH